MIRAEIKSKIKEDISLMVSMENHSWNYICDCGQASGYSVKEIQNTKAIFISHTHIDHFIGWDQIMRHQLGSKSTVTICGPKGIAKQIQAKLKAYTWNLLEEDSITYEIREIISEDLIKVYTLKPAKWKLELQLESHSNILYQGASFNVRFCILDHKTPSIAYRFDQENSLNINLKDSTYTGGPWINILKEAYKNNKLDQSIEIKGNKIPASKLIHLLEERKGSSLGVIMDHAANSENHSKIEQLFSNCDTVYIESFFKNEDKELADLHFHSYAKQSGSILKKIGVQKAVPMHFSRKYNDLEIEELIQEFEAAYIHDS